MSAGPSLHTLVKALCLEASDAAIACCVFFLSLAQMIVSHFSSDKHGNRFYSVNDRMIEALCLTASEA